MFVKWVPLLWNQSSTVLDELHVCPTYDSASATELSQPLISDIWCKLRKKLSCRILSDLVKKE